jgi:hypothetical protein
LVIKVFQLKTWLVKYRNMKIFLRTHFPRHVVSVNILNWLLVFPIFLAILFTIVTFNFAIIFAGGISSTMS